MESDRVSELFDPDLSSEAVLIKMKNRQAHPTAYGKDMYSNKKKKKEGET